MVDAEVVVQEGLWTFDPFVLTAVFAPDDFFLYPGVGYGVAVCAAGVVGRITNEFLLTQCGVRDRRQPVGVTPAFTAFAALIPLPLREGRGGSLRV